MAQTSHKERVKLHIAHIASEVEPFSKTGGLASVLGSLPRAQKEIGVDVVVITPLYEMLTDTRGLESLGETEDMEIEPGVFEKVSFWKGFMGDDDDRVPVYFIANKKFFGARTSLYGAKNDNARFLFFNIAALFLLKKIDFRASVLHCHDWHTGMIPFLMKTQYRRDHFWSKTATLFTIHNLSFQLGHDWHTIPADKSDDGRSKIPFFPRVNILKCSTLPSVALCMPMPSIPSRRPIAKKL